MKEANGESSRAIGCDVRDDVGIDYVLRASDRSSQPARGSGAGKSERTARAPHKAKATQSCRNSWRYSVGLTPHIRRNTRAKCCCVLKPQATPTSKTRASAARNISFARSTL